MKPILVVDDDPQMRSALKEAIQRIGYGADVCENGQEAIGRISRTGYSLVVTGMKMPGMDGLSVIREAKRLKADLPVIIITGYSTEASAIEAVNLGVAGYLTKPFRVPQVLAAAAKAIGETG